MQPLSRIVTYDRGGEQPVYIQIANALIRGIRNGQIRTGKKLPGSRSMGHLLNVNRTTICAVYDELEAQGWIRRLPRKGTFVNRDLPDIQPRSLPGRAGREPGKKNFSYSVDFEKTIPFPVSGDGSAGVFQLVVDDGFPDVRIAPMDELFRAMRNIAGRASNRKLLGYGSPAGNPVLRRTFAEHLNDTRGMAASEKNILITRGAQMGFYLAARLLVRPGDGVITGDPGYFGAKLTFKQQGARICPAPVDRYGIDVDAVEEICERETIKFVYVIPHHHHPTTATLTPERRIRLLQLAKKYRFVILEDDFDYDFHYSSNPILPMASLDEYGSVIYIGTLTKALAPAVRVGFMVGPEEFIQSAADLRRMIDWQGDNLMEQAVAELYRDGTIARHIKKSVKLYRKRRDHFCGLLDDALKGKVLFRVPDGGMSLWVKFYGPGLKKITEKAAGKGLKISDGGLYEKYDSARMGFASLTTDEQEKAIEILADCIQE